MISSRTSSDKQEQIIKEIQIETIVPVVLSKVSANVDTSYFICLYYTIFVLFYHDLFNQKVKSIIESVYNVYF